MLVLTRKNGELVRIAGSIEITILGTKSGKVRLGIKAPAETPIERPDAKKKAA